MKYAGASRAYPGETQNGDRWIVQRRDDALRVAVIDGLGHGPAAADAANAAIASLEEAPHLDPSGAVAACGHYLRGTRGAAASVLLLERGRATFAGIGNVEARIVTSGRDQRLSPDRGVLGGTIRAPRAIEVALQAPWTAIVHSDGVMSRAEMSLPTAPGADLEELARAIVSKYGRPTDDATIVIVSEN